MRILVTGASGFVGSLLVPRLCAQGHTVRALGREPERVRATLARTSARAHHGDAPTALDRVEVVRADALTAEGLAEALADVEVAYYLIHSMERSTSADSAFPERERIAAENFAAAASREGVRRIVYLGGLVPRGEGASTARIATHPDMPVTHISSHLASREEVERILLGTIPDSLALRASIVVGAGSRSFRLLVHLLERMPVLTLPAWQALRTQPIDERDAIEMLSACAGSQLSGRSLDIGGPDVLTYGEMLSAIAELMLISRPTIKLGVNLTAVTARMAAAIAGEEPELVLPLMEGLNENLLPADDHAAELLGVRLHSFDSAVEHALAEWEQSESLAAR
jgi:uncharacterized protein YbjT (DUF2867 family)